MEDGIKGPAHQDNDHHRGDLHHAKRFVTGLFYALDVLPPIVSGHQQSECRSRMVYVNLRRAMEHAVHGPGYPAMLIRSCKQLIDKTGDVLSGSYAGNRAGEDVVEHQRGNAEFG